MSSARVTVDLKHEVVDLDYVHSIPDETCIVAVLAIVTPRRSSLPAVSWLQKL